MARRFQIRWPKLSWLVVSCLAGCLVAPWLRAVGNEPGGTPAPDKAAKPADAGQSTKAPKRLSGFTEEREAAALTFARANHPELVALLEQLKQSEPIEYQRAIRDLFHSSEKLAQLQERNPRRYPTELENWKLSSRIGLLVARLSMTPDPAIEDQLRQALAAQINLKKTQLTDERERLEARLAELKVQLQQLDENQAQQIEQRLAKLLSDANKSRSELRASRSANSKKKKSDEKKSEDKKPEGKSEER